MTCISDMKPNERRYQDPEPVTNKASRIERLALGDLTLDPNLQVRGGCDGRTIDEYAALMVADPPTEFDPIDVFDVGGTFYLAHGWHRYHAAQRAKLDTIVCSIIEGTMEEAFEFALGANKKNGRRLTRKELWNAIDVALRQFSRWSDSRIADHVGCTHPTVGRRRKAHLKTLQVRPRDAFENSDPEQDNVRPEPAVNVKCSDPQQVEDQCTSSEATDELKSYLRDLEFMWVITDDVELHSGNPRSALVALRTVLKAFATGDEVERKQIEHMAFAMFWAVAFCAEFAEATGDATNPLRLKSR